MERYTELDSLEFINGFLVVKERRTESFKQIARIDWVFQWLGLRQLLRWKRVSNEFSKLCQELSLRILPPKEDWNCSLNESQLLTRWKEGPVILRDDKNGRTSVDFAVNFGKETKTNTKKSRKRGTCKLQYSAKTVKWDDNRKKNSAHLFLQKNGKNIDHDFDGFYRVFPECRPSTFSYVCRSDTNKKYTCSVVIGSEGLDLANIGTYSNSISKGVAASICLGIRGSILCFDTKRSCSYFRATFLSSNPSSTLSTNSAHSIFARMNQTNGTILRLV